MKPIIPTPPAPEDPVVSPPSPPDTHVPPPRRYRPGERVEIGAMDGLDLILLLALLPLHWTLFLLVVAQWFVRRNPVLLDGLLRPAGVDISRVAQSPRAREWLPALNEVLDAQLGQPTVPEVRSGAAEPPALPPRPAHERGVGAAPALLTTLLAQPLVPPAPAALGVLPAPAQRAPLSFATWRKIVLAAPNVIVVGNPGSGKSTVTRALLPAFAQQGHICVLDPHGMANDWGELEAIGRGREYAALCEALVALTEEMDVRYRTRPPHPPLSIVIDEVPSITLHAKALWEQTYPQLVFEGRKVGIRTVVMAQSAQVKPLGLDGKGDLRSSLCWVYLGRFAVEQCPAAAALAYPAAMAWEGVITPIDTSPLPVYARLPVPATAQWFPPKSGGSRAGAGAGALPVGDAAAPVTPDSDTGADGQPDPDAQLVAMMQRGVSVNALKKYLGGNGVQAREYIRQVAVRHQLDQKYH